MAATATVYYSRNPQSSDYYRCVQDHFETFSQVYKNEACRIGLPQKRLKMPT